MGPTARAEAFQEFRVLVERLGGDARALLGRYQIQLAALEDPSGLISYAAMLQVLEHAAAQLQCPDFGMRLARLQGAGKIVSPLGVAMRNSRTLGEALQYCAEHNYVFSSAMDSALEALPDSSRVLMRYDIRLDQIQNQRQAMEHALLLVSLATPQMSGGLGQGVEVWFSHEALAPLATYAENFGTRVRFGRPVSGIVFPRRALGAVVPNRDRQLYNLATSFIDQSGPRRSATLGDRTRDLIADWLPDGDCAQERVADALGLHGRTLQRRLKEEGQTFEEIKDGVRKVAALRHLRQPIPLVQVAAALGYAELSTLSRNCCRWFSMTPRRLRRELQRRDREAAAEATGR